MKGKGTKKVKYESGEAARFVSRKHAMRKLQLNLKDFRRLCILKGIHPREPRNRKRAQKGNLSKIQTLFHEKDIRFLLHEPIVYKFRDFKVFLKKLKKAHDKGNFEAEQRLKSNKPKYNLDHIVKERYPTFVDSIRDLEDCLCLCSLYATFPKSPRTPTEMIDLCRRLTVEFMHYVIEARALRKVFVSIKGYYYQAEIMGQIVTWVVPHQFAYDPPESVDIKLMSIFVEFYTTMLGFVNFRLYHNLNLQYPPALPHQTQLSTGEDSKQEDESFMDRVAALNQSLARTVAGGNEENEEDQLDDIPMADGSQNPEAVEAAKAAAEELRRLKSLFKGKRFFLGREIPRESLVFMIRAFGGEASWDETCAPGATFKENESQITHQINDRPKESVNMKHVGARYYIQPQWIFDSINQRKLLPESEYFVGEVLPPHLSPFVDASSRRIGDYIPPEEKKLLGMEDESAAPKKKASEDEEEEEEDSEEEDESNEEEEEEEEESEASGDDVEETEGKATSKMSVEAGKAAAKEEDAKALEAEEFRLRAMMVKKKHRPLYKSMMKARKRRVHESRQLEWKRKEHDAMEKKASKKKASSKAKKAASG